MKTHIDTITAFIAGQMDGEPVPASSSKALNQLSEAINAIHADASDNTLQTLGLMALSAVITRVRSNIVAEQTLQTFIRGDDHA